MMCPLARSSRATRRACSNARWSTVSEFGAAPVAESNLAEVAKTLQPLRLNHLGVAVRSIAGALTLHTEVLGQRVLSGPFDDPIQKVRVCFLGTDREGDVVVELVEPLGSDSPIRQMLAKGVAGYHVCY